MKKGELRIRKEDLYPALTLIAMLWGIYILQVLGVFKRCYGVIPWDVRGIKGIFVSPLFHGSWNHLISNSAPLFILTVLLFLFYKKQAYTVLILGSLVSGLLLWLLPDFSYWQDNIRSCHIGASGLIYLLVSFLFFSGIFLRKIGLILLSVLVVVLYGGLIYGIFPNLVAESVSWQGHLIGGIVGFFFAYRLNRKKS